MTVDDILTISLESWPLKICQMQAKQWIQQKSTHSFFASWLKKLNPSKTTENRLANIQIKLIKENILQPYRPNGQAPSLYFSATVWKEDIVNNPSCQNFDQCIEIIYNRKFCSTWRKFQNFPAIAKFPTYVSTTVFLLNWWVRKRTKQFPKHPKIIIMI